MKQEKEIEQEQLNASKPLICRKSQVIAKKIQKSAYLNDKKKQPRCTSQRREEMFERLKDGKSSLYKSSDRKNKENDTNS